MRCVSKKGLWLGVRMAVMASSIVFFAAVAGFAAETVSVAKDGVNLRSGPDTTSAVIFELPKGYPLQVLSKEGEWLKVSDYENDKGWVHASVTSKDQYVIVKANEGNIRAEPNTKSASKGSVTKDVILKKIKKEGDWVQVSHPEVEGWMHQQLLWP